MGLDLEVGYLADMLENDADGAAHFRDDLARLNQFLVAQGLPAHIEPESCPVFSSDMYGYSGLHYLRRIAAHLDLRGTLPPPGDEHASEDTVLLEYYRKAERPSGVLDRLLRRSARPGKFDHLILHGDAEGYYLPFDIPTVLFPPNRLKIAGGMVGSAVRLRDECRQLAEVLELPLDLDPETEEVWDAVESQGEGTTRWQRYGVESYTCLQLHCACEHSLRHGAAIVFC
jgi:hypothetical protein